MRLLVTGGAGFVGCNLAKMAVSSGLEVTVIDDLSTGNKSNLAGVDLRFIQGSILDAHAVDEALAGVDSVVHLAALPSVPRSIKNPLESHAANATGTLGLLERCREMAVSHVVTASSSSVYGTNPALPKSEREWVRPMSPYAVSKMAAEQYTLAYQQSFGLETTAFRFFNVYGPGQAAGHAYAAVIPTFIDALLNDRPLPLHGDGTQSRDFTYVGTVCRVLLSTVARRLSHPEPINLAYGSKMDLNGLIQILEEATGRRAAIGHLPSRAGDVKHSQADNRVLTALFPDVQPVPLKEGIMDTLKWFEDKS